MDSFERQYEIDKLNALVAGLNEDEQIFGLVAEDLERRAKYEARLKELQQPNPQNKSEDNDGLH